MRRLSLLLVALLALAACGSGEETALETDTELDIGTDTDTDTGYDLDDQPADAQATFSAPGDGDVVASPVRVDMAASEVEIVPAGDPAAGEGHLHVTVDAGCVEQGEVVPGPDEQAEADGYHHFGDGSTTGNLDLEGGRYELCLQLADGAHRVFGGSDVITITVE